MSRSPDPAGREAHAAHVASARGTDQAEVAADFIGEFAFGDADRSARAEVEVSHFSRVGDDGEGGDIFEVVSAALLADLLDTQQASGGRDRTTADFDPGSAQGRQILGLRYLLTERQPQRFQALVERSNRVVAHR